jgi:hypothetical protein
MGPNAIRISDRVEKVELDFASDESLKESLGFARLYTIHTAKTNEMSQRLGFHIGGYCDDRGRGGPALAASLVGYECLPSDVVLFKMDEKYNPLPLNEEELNSLFVFLKTGKVISPEAKLQIQEFFKEHNIDLALPDFPLPMESIRFAQLPNLIAIIAALVVSIVFALTLDDAGHDMVVKEWIAPLQKLFTNAVLMIGAPMTLFSLLKNVTTPS